MSLKLLAVILAICVFVPASLAACDYTLNYGAFARDSPFLVAVANGYFAAQNVCVNFNFVAGSIPQFNDLLAGNYDLINTAADNVAARVVNLGLNLTIVAGVDLGIGLDLIVNTNNVTGSDWSQLACLPIAVDAPDSGFVLDLLYMARANGVNISIDKFQLIGGALGRFNALVAGYWTNPQTHQNESVVASMLNNPFTVRSTPPLHIFAKFSDYVAPYQNAILATTSDWLRNHDHQVALKRFLIAWSQAQMFITNPANRNAVISILQGPGSGQSLAQASASYAEITYAPSSVNPNCLANILGLQNIISVRQSLGYFNSPVNVKRFVKNNQSFGFYDSRFCHQALDAIGADTFEDDGIYN
jgi:ABC-type nitrate/sulfonate/bicarbonate transport system substrate-binding protein